MPIQGGGGNRYELFKFCRRGPVFPRTVDPMIKLYFTCFLSLMYICTQRCENIVKVTPFEGFLIFWNCFRSSGNQGNLICKNPSKSPDLSSPLTEKQLGLVNPIDNTDDVVLECLYIPLHNLQHGRCLFARHRVWHNRLPHPRKDWKLQRAFGVE